MATKILIREAGMDPSLAAIAATIDPESIINPGRDEVTVISTQGQAEKHMGWEPTRPGGQTIIIDGSDQSTDESE